MRESQYLDRTETPHLGNEVHDKIHSILKTHQYVSLDFDDIDSLTDWQHDTCVRSSQTSENPINFMSRNSHGGIDYRPLDGTFERIESYLDSQTNMIMVRITIHETDRKEASATDWVPLDHLSFYGETRDIGRASDIRIGQLATALLNGSGDVDEFNSILNSDGHLYRPGLQPAPTSQRSDKIIAGHAVGETIKDIGAVPIVKPDNFSLITIVADRLVVDHERPWVVSESGLCLPMQRRGRFICDIVGLWMPYIDLEELIADTAID